MTRAMQSKARAAAMAARPVLWCALGLIAGAPVYGQAQQPAPGGTLVLEEIVVSARKREENLQETPISVSAFDADALAQRNVSNIAEIGNFTPNLIMDSAASLAGSSATVTTFIRGVGQNDFNLTIDPGVGIYLDGVYVSRSVGALLDTVDLARVEVLRGPQGTLFGKNTIGGAVVLTSKPPSDVFEASIEATYGRYDRTDLEAMVNVPLTDRLAVRASASLQKRDGYVERLFDGETMGDKDSLSGRVAALWRPTDTLSFTLAVDATRNREQAKPATLLAVNPFADFVAFWNFAANGAACFTPPTGLPIPDRAPCFTGRFITGDPYTTVGGGPNYSDLDLFGVGLTADWDLGTVRLKSITSYRDLDSRFYQDYDNSPLPIGETSNDYTHEQFSQELQLSGNALAARLQWLVGLYYLEEKGTDVNDLVFSVADFRSGGRVENESVAAFAQITYALGDRWRVTPGLRYTDESKRFAPDQFIRADRTGGQVLALSRLFIPVGNPDGNLILPRGTVETKAEEWTPSLSVDYRVTDDVLAYASYSQGFKSGGFTQRVFPPEPVTPSFGPEFVDSYELGLKTELLARRVRLNAAVFHTDYSGLQIIVNEGIAPKVRNAGEATIRGFEVDAEAVLTDRVRLSAGLGYTDAEYDRVDPAAAGITRENDFANVPDWTATAGVSADLYRSRVGVLGGRIDWSYRGAHYKDAVNSPEIRQGSYALLNASLSFVAADERWRVTAGATNLTDEEYLITGYQNLAEVGVATGTYGRPREWYLGGQLRF